MKRGELMTQFNSIRKSVAIAAIAAAIVSTSNAQAAEPATGDAPMIEITAPQSIQTPFGDAEQNPVEAYLVRYEGLDQNTVSVEFLPITQEQQMLDLASQYGATGEIDFWRERLLPRVSLKLGSPQVLSAGIGVMIGARNCRKDYYQAHTCVFDGVLIEAEPGLGGGKASVGLGSHWVIYSWAAKLSLLHTWGLSTVQPGQTYLGGELDVTAFFLRFSGGLFQRLGVGPADQAQIISLSGGVGF